MLIEDKAFGTQLIQELIQQGFHAVTRYQPQSDKVMRMRAQTAMIENGFAHLPKEAGWLAEYLHELTVFPDGNARRPGRFDRTDTRLAQAGRPRAGGIYQYCKELAQQAGTPQTARPAPVSSITTRFGILRW